MYFEIFKKKHLKLINLMVKTFKGNYKEITIEMTKNTVKERCACNKFNVKMSKM